MAFRTGIENLVLKDTPRLKGRTIALASHLAAVNTNGVHAADIMQNAGLRLAALFGPEHGFAGTAGAGAKVKSSRYGKHSIPIYSLYGTTRKPTPEMLSGIDTVVIDFQDLPARCYTYLATMINIMEAAAEQKVEVVVADRPVPLPNTVDGPPLTKGFNSFVAPAPLPMAYGMTPGEAAIWISRFMKISPELRVSKMSGYRREEYPQPDWPAWRNPSPGITSWDSAVYYLSTVSCEALPVLETFRGSSLSFQAFSTPWLKTEMVAGLLNSEGLRGVRFHPVEENRTVLLEVTSPRIFKPVLTGIAILSAIQEIHGRRKLWTCSQARARFFDKLFGGRSARLALQKGRSTKAIASSWTKSIRRFQRQRSSVLLYRKGPAW